MGSKRAKRGKYRDSKHYREWKGNSAKTYKPSASKSVKSTPSSTTTSSVTTALGTKKHCIAVHWQSPFGLGDGEVIFASAWADRPKNAMVDDTINPDMGVYFDEYWAARTRHMTSPGVTVPGLGTGRPMVLFEWADYGIPRDMGEFDTIIRWMYDLIKDGKLVDTGCFASHGRTGTALAALLILKGRAARDAIEQVRDEHCWKAIETGAQKDWLYEYDELVNGRKAPRPRRLPPVKVVSADALHDKYGRRLPEPEPTLDESTLNDMTQEEAYEEWLKLNTSALQEYEWCEWCDLPNTLCNCDPDWIRIDAADAEWEQAQENCTAPPCFSPGSCNPGECWAEAIKNDARDYRKEDAQ